MNIVFKNPPVSASRRGPRAATQGIIDALKSRPGEWALIKADVSAASGTAWKKRDGFQVRTSSVGKSEGKWDIYARWVGEAK